MTDRSLGHRAPLLWLALPYMGGLAAGHSGLPPGVPAALAAALVAAAAAVAAAVRFPRASLAALVAAMILGGDASALLHGRRPRGWESGPPREARVSLRIERVYPQRSPRRAGGIAAVVAAAAPLGNLVGQRTTYALTLRRGQPAPGRSDVVSVAGRLGMPPAGLATDTYDGGLEAQGINLRLSRGRLLAVERPAPAYRRFCERLAVRVVCNTRTL